MKNHALKIYLILGAAFALFMGINAFTGRAQTPAADTPVDYCAVSSDYNKPELDAEQIMELYHKTINEKFNKYIERMIEAETKAAKTGERGADGRPPEPVSEKNPQLLQDCPKDGSNFSTYCVGVTLLTNETFGYVAYQRALDCKRNQLFDSTKKQNAWNDYINVMTCLGGVESILPPDKCTQEEKARLEKEIGGVYQAQQALTMSARLEAIAREKTAAKRALDQTLAAYNELRTAWPMHQKYMRIYDSLIKYRDKMVEIRNQVEEFPSKFIDASTTKCS